MRMRSLCCWLCSGWRTPTTTRSSCCRRTTPGRSSGSSSVCPSSRTFCSSSTGRRPGTREGRCISFFATIDYVTFLSRIHEKYETVQETIQELLQEKRPEKEKEKFKGKEYVYWSNTIHRVLYLYYLQLTVQHLHLGIDADIRGCSRLSRPYLIY